jgi:hypothetical protein
LVLRDDSGGGVWKKLLWPILVFNSIIPWPPRRNDGPSYDLPLQRL